MSTNARLHPTAEHVRLLDVSGDDLDHASWRRWGPYVSDRSWATVREDYSSNGDAWNFLPHDLARSKAYRWGEDGIAGICDRFQFLVFAPAFWNGRDPILKERLFGLTPDEGNHGEDVKEAYFHVDNTPTHSYMAFAYKYPQTEFPYAELVNENRARQGRGPEYEIWDTGVFDEKRYFDIEIEYAKVDEEDLVIRLTAHNRGPEPAPLHLLPHLWFRNTWAWGPEAWSPEARQREPIITLGPERRDRLIELRAVDSPSTIPRGMPIPYSLGERALYADPGAAALFTDNESHMEHVFGPSHRSRSPYVKDAFHRHIIHGEDCLNPRGRGSKAALQYVFEAVPPGGSVDVRLRLSDKPGLEQPLDIVQETLRLRKREADAFYEAVRREGVTDEDAAIQRRAFAGMLWTKQIYLFDVHDWLRGDDPNWPPPESRWSIRNRHWTHLNSMRIMTVCDKWEYPWFAAWDLAFHCVVFALIDPQYAKDQLWVLLFEQFQHPNGQLPAYEWEFSDLNPPVHAWAIWRVYHMAADFDRRHYSQTRRDRAFLERCYHKLLINFAWWVNKVDARGDNIFEGGFLGLDNITVVDRSTPCASGAVIEQADATGWMGMYCLNLMRIALELARENPVYEGMATKFFQHYAYVAGAMKHMGNRDYQLWNDQDGFFYDVLRHPNGQFHTFRVRSFVGLIPLYAVERLETDWIEQFPRFRKNLQWFLKNRPDLIKDVVHEVRDQEGRIQTYVLTIVNREQLHRLLNRVWDPEEFLSDYGIRSLSKAHAASPLVFEDKSVGYEPGESVSKLKGGNSNWRGPVWLPTNFLLIESLRKLGKAWGQDDGIDLGGAHCTYWTMAGSIADRLISLFRVSKEGDRPALRGIPPFQHDESWKDHLLFHEYFHAETGAGLGASHQTGWTGLVASLIDEWRSAEAESGVRPTSERVETVTSNEAERLVAPRFQ